MSRKIGFGADNVRFRTIADNGGFGPAVVCPLLTQSAATVAFSQIASAADLPVKAPRCAPPLPPPYNWTGFYVGGNIGYSWGNTDSTILIPDLTTFGLGSFTDSLKPDGVIGGGQIGYNWQVDPRWVLGIEADFQGSGQKDSRSFSDPFTFFTFVPCDCEGGFITAAIPARQRFRMRKSWSGSARCGGALGTFSGTMGWSTPRVVSPMATSKVR